MVEHGPISLILIMHGCESILYVALSVVFVVVRPSD